MQGKELKPTISTPHNRFCQINIRKKQSWVEITIFLNSQSIENSDIQTTTSNWHIKKKKKKDGKNWAEENSRTVP